jgi:hypothetical protein
VGVLVRKRRVWTEWTKITKYSEEGCDGKRDIFLSMMIMMMMEIGTNYSDI